VSVPSSKAGAFEDGTDTWFRNVGTVHIDAGEIPKRTFTILFILFIKADKFML
jgi:hypothetical protein